MAHFAELDENNVVIQVIVGIDEDRGNGEEIYQLETGNVWKRTSYNTKSNVHLLGGTPFRGNYAGIGYIYDQVKDVFYTPKPFESWILNENSYTWESPVPYPMDGKRYTWDETSQSWIER